MDFLSNDAIDLSYLNDFYKKKLEIIFDKLPKPAVALWDLKVKRMVYSIYSKETLEKSRITNVLLDDRNTIDKSKKYKSMVIFIKSSIKMIQMTEEIINNTSCLEYHLVFVPKQLTCHKEYIEKNKLNFESKFASISQFQCYGVPLDSDVISVENPDFIMNMDDLATLYDLAKTIDIIQSIYGIIPKVSGCGEKVQKLMSIINIMNKNSPDSKFGRHSEIHQMLIFDRRIDMLTPLLCQITYEGLLDELFKFSSAYIEIPVGLLKNDGNLQDTELFQMNSSDGFYAEIRDSVLHEFLKKIFDFHKDVEAEREKYLKVRKLDEMAEVANNLKSFKSREKNAQFHFTLGLILTKYTKQCDYNELVNCQNNFISQIDIDKVHPMIEDFIVKKKDIDRVIQLICIQSLCANGLKPKILNWYKREILRTYGLPYAAVLTRLKAMELLIIQQTSSMIPIGERRFDTLLTTLNLVPEKEDVQSDISNIYAGFVPIITRLVEYHAKFGGWQNISKALALFPGQEYHSHTKDVDSENTNDRKVVLVVYIGGVTFSEISTLRFLSKQPDSNTTYIVLTTGIINNVKYFEQLTEPFAISKSINPFSE